PHGLPCAPSHSGPQRRAAGRHTERHLACSLDLARLVWNRTQRFIATRNAAKRLRRNMPQMSPLSYWNYVDCLQPGPNGPISVPARAEDAPTRRYLPCRKEKSSMRIAQVAPLAEGIPPRLYGGTERVISWLTE